MAALELHVRTFRRGAILCRENDATADVFILRQGWVYGCTLLPDGSRQILTLHLAGDMIGLGGTVFPRATETLVALTDVVVATFDLGALRTLFEVHPRLAAVLFARAQVERVQLYDRLTSLGRMPARGRVAGLLLDTMIRLRVVEPWIGDSFTMPMTQEEMGDMVGLTAVHVNRMMRLLSETGLIARQGHRITLIDEPGLGLIANHVNRLDGLELGWLPQGR